MQPHDCDEKFYNKKRSYLQKKLWSACVYENWLQGRGIKKKKQLPAKSGQNNELSTGAPEQMVGLSLLKSFCTNYGRLDIYLRLDISLINPLNWILSLSTYKHHLLTIQNCAVKKHSLVKDFRDKRIWPTLQSEPTFRWHDTNIQTVKSVVKAPPHTPQKTQQHGNTSLLRVTAQAREYGSDAQRWTCTQAGRLQSLLTAKLLTCAMSRAHSKVCQFAPYGKTFINSLQRLHPTRRIWLSWKMEFSFPNGTGHISCILMYIQRNSGLTVQNGCTCPCKISALCYNVKVWIHSLETSTQQPTFLCTFCHNRHIKWRAKPISVRDSLKHVTLYPSLHRPVASKESMSVPLERNGANYYVPLQQCNSWDQIVCFTLWFSCLSMYAPAKFLVRTIVISGMTISAPHI